MRRNRVLTLFAIVFSMSLAVFWLGNVLAAATVQVNNELTVSEGGSGTIDNTLLQSDDPDAPGATLTYTVDTVPANGDLILNGTTTLTVGSNFTQADIDANQLTYTHDDSETLSDSFDFTVATSMTTAPQDTFTITVTPVYDQMPTVNDQIFAVDENSLTGTAVGTIVTSDLDAADSLTYTIIGGNFGTPFAVGNSDGAITVDSETPLDFETNQSLTFTIEVEDLGALKDTAIITVNINDVNEPPILADFTIPNALPEDSGTGTFVGTVPAPIDPDSGESFNYSITGGNPGPTFFIGPSNGNLTVANTADLDFEDTPIYTLTVEVEDSGGLTDSASITINLEDVNEPPETSNATFTPNENTGNGVSIGFVDATDPEGVTLNYLLTGGNTNSAFAVNGTTGEITVNDTNALDYETTPSFTLTVDVDDGVNPAVEATVFINLVDQNETPTVNNASFNVDENEGNGTAVGTVSGSDPDANDIGSLTFAITMGNTGGAFAIINDGNNNGNITVADSNQLDYEVTQSFTLGIIVTDTGGLENTSTVTIDINNLFDENPSVSNTTFFVSEGDDNGVLVGTVSATDVELVSGDSLTYVIVGGNTGNVFAINSSNGQITVPDVSKLDADAMPTFNLTVEVTDLGGNVDTGIITINVSPLPITNIFLPIALNNYPPIEPNNNCSQAFPVATGIDYEFTADDTEDWYAVTLPTTGNLNVVLSSFEPAQGQLIVYGGSCGSLTLLQNDGSSSTTKTLSLTNQPSGTYYIRVFSAPVTNTPYNLRIN